MSDCEEIDGGGKVRSTQSTAGGKAVKGVPQPGSDPVVVLQVECPKSMSPGSLAGLQSCISGPKVSPDLSHIVVCCCFLGNKCVLAPNCHVLSAHKLASSLFAMYIHSN